MPASPYVICLDDAARAELEAVSRRATAPFRLVQRARIVLLAAGGLANRVIADRLGVCEDTARKWRRRYCQQRHRRAGRRAAAGPAADVLGPGRGRGQGPGLRAARRQRDAAGPLDLPRAGPPGGRSRHRRLGLRVHRAPLARRATRSSRGSTGRGSSPATRTSPSRAAVPWTFTSGNGKDSRSARTSTCSAPTRSPASRPARASTSRCRPGPGGRCAPRASTSAAAPWPTWPPTTSTAPGSSAGASRPPGSSRSPRSSTRS